MFALSTVFLTFAMTILHVCSTLFNGYMRVQGVISTRHDSLLFVPFGTCSASRCVLACMTAKDNSCSVAQYNTVDGRCQMYNWREVKWLRLREPGKENVYDVYIGRDQKVLYIGGDERLYAFSLEEGRESCRRVGGELASTDDLKTAKHDGWEICACGWLNNGHAYFLVSAIQPGCGVTNLYKCSHQAAFGAHCVFV